MTVAWVQRIKAKLTEKIPGKSAQTVGFVYYDLFWYQAELHKDIDLPIWPTDELQSLVQGKKTRQKGEMGGKKGKTYK